jgi:hypothetical protein
MILRQHDGGMTEQQRLARAIATARSELERLNELIELLENERNLNRVSLY